MKRSGNYRPVKGQTYRKESNPAQIKNSYTRYNFFCDLEKVSTLLPPGCTYVWYEVDVVKEIVMIERLEKL